MGPRPRVMSKWCRGNARTYCIEIEEAGKQRYKERKKGKKVKRPPQEEIGTWTVWWGRK